MTQPQSYLDADRRRPHVSHEELRRELVASDEERYRMRRELDALSTPAGRAHVRRWRPWPPRRRGVTIGVGAAVAGMLAGAAFWKVYAPPVRADDRSVRVETMVVTAHVVPPQQISTASIPPRVDAVREAPRRAASESHPHRSLRKSFGRALLPPWHMMRAMRHLRLTPRRDTIPRPRGPREFGRKAL